MSNATRVLRYLAAAGPSIRAHISAATGIPPEPLGGLLYRLHMAGDIARADDDYRMPLPTGRCIPVAVWIGVTVPPPEEAPPDGIHGPIVQQALARLPALHNVWRAA